MINTAWIYEKNKINIDININFDIDKEMKKYRYYNENYEFIEAIPILDEQIALGDKNNRICRFCGKTKPEVTFRKKAHAIPELIGNKKLISYYECDTCNWKFSQLENHLSNYLSIWRTLAQTPGKNGVPSFKTEQSRIDVADKVIIKDQMGSGFITETADKHEITFKAFKGSYVPMAVYKCFVKMALSIMPENEIKFFDNTIKWILDETSKSLNKQLFLFWTFTPGPQPYKTIANYLLKRINSSGNTPYMIYVIAFTNFMYQIYLPFCKQDQHLVKNNMSICLFPPIVPSSYGRIINDLEDLSSSELKKKEPIAITMSYGSKTEIPVEKEISLI